jgi:hypothetical protein
MQFINYNIDVPYIKQQKGTKNVPAQKNQKQTS